MVPKSRPQPENLRLVSEYIAFDRHNYRARPEVVTAPEMLYANLDFTCPDETNVHRLLNWITSRGLSGWKDKRAIAYLEAHQGEFRRCLLWLSGNSEVYFEGRFWMGKYYGDSDFHKVWTEQPELKFLQQHGLEHGGIALEPNLQDRSYFRGLKLVQRKPKDPLDPLCWHLLFTLSLYGPTRVRQCGYWKCETFFFQPTQREKMFCSNSHRALQHVANIEFDDLDPSDEELGGIKAENRVPFESEMDKFRKKKAAAMRALRTTKKLHGIRPQK